MSEVPNFAPGCFGSALAFKEGDPVCGTCVFAQRCKPLHEEAHARLIARCGVKLKPLSKPKVERPRPQTPEEAFGLPVKTQELIRSFNEGNFDIRGSLQRGVNPFAKAGRPFMRIACQVLLVFKQKGLPLQPKTIQMAMCMGLEWSEKTAAAYTRMAVVALVHVGAVTVLDGSLQIREN